MNQNNQINDNMNSRRMDLNNLKYLEYLKNNNNNLINQNQKTETQDGEKGRGS